MVRRLAGSSVTVGQSDLYYIRATHTETHPKPAQSTPVPTAVKFGIDSSPPGRVQPALPTGTQGQEDKPHGIGLPPPLAGRLGVSGELGSSHKMSESHSTTIVRVPGSYGDSGFYPESLGEDIRIKTEPRIEASAKERSS